MDTYRTQTSAVIDFWGRNWGRCLPEKKQGNKITIFKQNMLRFFLIGEKYKFVKRLLKIG